MNSTHYDNKYYQDKEKVADHLVLTIADVLRKSGAKKVLEVGCGTGFVTNFLNHNGFDCFGCDISFFAASKSRQVNASALQLPFKTGSVDALISISMVEHLKYEETKEFLQEARRVLKNNGIIFLVTPNSKSVRSLIYGAKQVHSADPTHIFFYSPFSLGKVLGSSGFTNIRCLFDFPKKCKLGGWPLPASLRQTNSSLIMNMFNWLFVSSPLALFRDSFWISATKNEF